MSFAHDRHEFQKAGGSALKWLQKSALKWLQKQTEAVKVTFGSRVFAVVT